MSAAPTRARGAASLAVSAAALALGVGLLALLPLLLGTTWSEITRIIGAVHPGVLLGLVLLWAVGLVIHLPVLCKALPGLSARQALGLNLAGSAVTNVMPAGGAAGAGLGFAMARSWGFTAEAYAAFALVSNLWNALARLLVGVGILGTAALLGVDLPGGTAGVALTALGLVVVLGGASALALRSEPAAAAAADRCERLWHRLRALGPRRRRPAAPVGGLRERVLTSRRDLIASVADGWATMTVAVVAYVLCQGLLLVACLAAVGADASRTAICIAFALERLLTLVPLTPGSAGLVELGGVAALHLLGVDAADAAAGVLLYRTLTYAAEIPIGGAVALAWLHGRRRRPQPPASEPVGRPAEVDGAATAAAATTSPTEVAA